MDADEILFANQVLNDLDETEQVAAEPGREFHVFDKIDPFHRLPDRKFQKCFRVSKEFARNLIAIITPFMEEPTRRSALSIEYKVLVALKFYGFGSYQEITGTNKFLSVSQSSVSRCVKEVSEALNRPEIFNNWVHFPRNMNELRQLRRRFFEKYFPGIVGCVDCTHVAIVRPNNNDPIYPENIYINRKQYHSINVQLICDENLRILNANVRFPGSSHDAHIWRQSDISTSMEEVSRHNPQDSFFSLEIQVIRCDQYVMLSPIRLKKDSMRDIARLEALLKDVMEF